MSEEQDQIPEGAKPFTLDLEMTGDGQLRHALPDAVHHQIPETPRNLYAHDWKQRGNELYCDSCAVPHGHLLDPHMMLVANSPTKGPSFRNILTDEVDIPGEHKHYMSK